MATKSKKPILKKQNMAPIDAVQNPNFDQALAQQNYLNNLQQSLANLQAQNYPTMGSGQLGPNLEIPTGRLGGLTAEQAGISPEQKKILDQLGPNLGIPTGGFGGLTAQQAGISPQQKKILDELMAKQQAEILTQGSAQQKANLQGSMIGIPNPAQSNQQNPQMQQIQDYNKMLQQGMQRNQEINKAAQNFAVMGAPSKSFSQVAGGIGRMNKMPRQTKQNFITPNNQNMF